MINKDKKILRRELLDIRNGLTKDYVYKSSEKIIENLEKTYEYENSDVIFCYVSHTNEVNTIEFIEKNIGTKNICIPRINSDNTMTPYYINSIESLVRNKFNILEPNKNEKIADINDIDIAVVPGVGFDTNFNRLGHGCGFYDRFFASANESLVKIGLCFEAQLVERIPSDKLDVKMDIIITENRIIGGRYE